MKKTCTKCGEEKLITEFGNDSRKRDGLRSWCRSCTSIANAKQRAANPEKAKASVAKWCAANPEKVNAYKAAYRSANPDKVKAARAKWKAKNPEKVKKHSAKWRAARHEVRRIHEQNRRARKREAGGRLSAGLAERLYKLQRGKCACGCGKPLGNDYHLDHRMPIAMCGVNEDWNIQLLTAACNMQKNAKHPIEFMQSRGFLL